MSRLCFLDIDGVLNHTELGDWNVRGIDPAAVALLNELATLGDVEFVLSSSWRKLYRLSTVEADLIAAGFLGHLEGHTPAIDCVPRGEEIATYIKQWPGRHTREIEGLVILDDDSDMHPLLHRHVQTRNSVGLTRENVEQAEAHLRDPFDWDELP